jgi:hypothetical protein
MRLIKITTVTFIYRMFRALILKAVPPKTFTLLVHVVVRHDLADEVQWAVTPYHHLLAIIH